MKKIRTVDGDTVDRLLWQHLARNDEHITDAFWRLNPHAAAHGPIFMRGVTLMLPDIPEAPEQERFSPWQ